MVGRSKRRIFKTGDSKAITLPKEWVEECETNEVHVVFDNLLIVFKDKDKAEDFAEKYIAQVTGVEI